MNHYVRVFTPAVLLGAGVMLISGVREQYTTRPRQPIVAISREFAGLNGSDVEIDSTERKVAGMTDYMLRDFRRDSAQMFTVYVGYYDRQVQGKTIHSPKNCLPGAGWEILNSSEITLPNAPNGRVNRVMLANKGTQALVYYWYQGRGRVESNEYRVKWNLLRDAAVHGRTEEALVRIVVPILHPKQVEAGVAGAATFEAADVIARDVAIRLVTEVSKVMPTAPGA